MNLAIETKALSFAYGNARILQQVNVGFHENKFSVLLGTNGSGKSTFFKCITGLLTDYEGEVYVNKQPVKNLAHKQKAALIGFLPQFYQTVFPFTVADILLTGRAAFSGFAPTKKDRARVNSVLAELEITSLEHKLFTQLSGGEQQMVMIGRLLMQDPEIIILDEPTNHLDVYYQNFLMEKLRGYAANGKTIIAVMHNPTLAYQFADHFFFMHDSTILSPSYSDVPDIDVLKSVYNTNFLNIQHNNLKIVLPVR